MNSEEDRLSLLPDHIIHEILRFIPIRCAAQTMILSHSWKKIFASIPHLDFTTIAPSPPPRRPAGPRYPTPMEPPCDVRDINFLNNTLALHDDNFPIMTLKLKSSELSCKAFNFLIKYPAKTNHIQELDVKVENEDYFNIPWSIIHCGRLRVLRLYINFFKFDDKLIKPSVMMQSTEFKFLHTLILYKLSFLLLFPDKHVFTDSSFPCLNKFELNCCCRVKELTFRCSGLNDLVITSCARLTKLDIYGLNLEKLNVGNCNFHSSDNDTKINIIAPVMKVLKWLHIPSNHIPVFLEKSHLLDKAVISLFPQATRYDPIGPENIHRMSTMMTDLSHVKFLKFGYQSIQTFLIYDAKKILVNKFESLKSLKISKILDFGVTNDFPVYAAIFKNSPILETLVISIKDINWDKWPMNYSSDDKYWEDQIPEINCFLNHIRTVKLDGFLEYYTDISLPKFLLKHGKVLEEMIFCIGLDTEAELARRKFVKSTLMKCSKTSSKAKLVFQ